MLNNTHTHIMAQKHDIMHNFLGVLLYFSRKPEFLHKWHPAVINCQTWLDVDHSPCCCKYASLPKPYVWIYSFVFPVFFLSSNLKEYPSLFDKYWPADFLNHSHYSITNFPTKQIYFFVLNVRFNIGFNSKPSFFFIYPDLLSGKYLYCAFAVQSH